MLRRHKYQTKALTPSNSSVQDSTQSTCMSFVLDRIHFFLYVPCRSIVCNSRRQSGQLPVSRRQQIRVPGSEHTKSGSKDHITARKLSVFPLDYRPHLLSHSHTQSHAHTVGNVCVMVRHNERKRAGTEGTHTRRRLPPD